MGIAFSVAGLAGSGGSTVAALPAILPATTATPSTLDVFRKLRREESGCFGMVTSEQGDVMPARAISAMSAVTREAEMKGRQWLNSLFSLRLHPLPFLLGQLSSECCEFACSLQPLAPVHGDDFAVDIAGTVAHQKRREIREFFCGTEASQRIALFGRVFQFRTRQQARERSFGRDRARRNRIHADAAVPPLDSQASRQRLHSGLGDGGRYDVSRTAGRISRRDVQHNRWTLRGQPPASTG